MYAVAKAFLHYLNTTNVSEDKAWEVDFPKPAYTFLERVYEQDVWDGEFREKISAVRAKNISDLSISEIYTYFTAIICAERVCGGFFEEHAENGVLKELLERYISLCDEKENAQ